MSNYQCPECGTTHIDCGKYGYKTPKELELEEENRNLTNLLNGMSLLYYNRVKENEILNKRLNHMIEISNIKGEIIHKIQLALKGDKQ